jgi:hypothetical protein
MLPSFVMVLTLSVRWGLVSRLFLDPTLGRSVVPGFWLYALVPGRTGHASIMTFGQARFLGLFVTYLDVSDMKALADRLARAIFLEIFIFMHI